MKPVIDPSSWIHSLAKSENNPELDLHATRAFNGELAIEESAIAFLGELKEHFASYCRTFNAYSDQGAKFQEIRIYALAGNPADFMMFRSQVKLMVTHAAHGAIEIAFSHHRSGTLAVDAPLESQTSRGSSQLTAHVGPFHDVVWTFQGERVTAEQVAKYYFQEFARATRDGSKLKRPQNQQLLDQIRSLLNDRGLTL
jgi:hypothetical protein